MKPIQENIIANLSEISDNFLSHPDYPYREHIRNIAESFDDESHRFSAFFHDFGKLSDSFQAYIKNPSSAGKTGVFIQLSAVSGIRL